jgi:hygromycin-B 4-O-kinase
MMTSNQNESGQIDSHEAQTFLNKQLGAGCVDVALIGEGAWSRCFGFRQGDADLVIRFGRDVDDFENDRLAYRYAAPDLPIPQVLESGSYGGGYYAISTRVHGMPLEEVSAAQWRAVVPSLAAALEAMRTADISATNGFGGWGSDGNAPKASWSEHLLAVNQDTPDRRTYGWGKRLATFSPQGEAAFAWGYDLLREVAADCVPRCLLHCDLINRNVLVKNEKIEGVFDWGCSLYGDHLYELAWFEFWAPWSPQLDVPFLRAALEKRWQAADYAIAEKEARLMACYLHVGLDHLAYNAYLGDWETLLATANRMKDLATAVLYKRP